MPSFVILRGIVTIAVDRGGEEALVPLAIEFEMATTAGALGVDADLVLEELAVDPPVDEGGVDVVLGAVAVFLGREGEDHKDDAREEDARHGLEQGLIDAA